MIGLLSKTLPMLTKVSQLASKLPKGLGARGSRMIGSGFNNIKSISDSRLVVTTYDEYRPDLVLLDLNMPHVTGFEVIDQLKKAQNGNHLKEKKGTGFEPRMVDAFKKVLPEMVKIVNRLPDFAETNGEKHLLKIFRTASKKHIDFPLKSPLESAKLAS